MVVRKIFEGTLVSGTTSIAFTDSDIPNSLIRVYSNDDNLSPVSMNISGNTITITYPEQTSNKSIALEIVKAGLEIIDNVTSTASDKALSANQGKILKDAIDSIVIPEVPEKITDLSDVEVTSIQNDQILAWDSVSEKFVNVTPSGGSTSEVYSETEQLVGEWIDSKPIYKITITKNNFAMTNGISFAHNISNIDTCIKMEALCVDTSNNTSFSTLAMGTIYYSTGSDQEFGFRCTRTNIVGYGKNEFSASATRTWYFTVFYTKTS